MTQKTQDNIFPIVDRMVDEAERALLFGHPGRVCWIFGLSGSGKSTLALSLERVLLEAGVRVVLLDGDNLRGGLNKDLGFSDDDREENLRRTAEVAGLLARQGLVVLVCVISPLRRFREMAREIIGADKFLAVYVDASYEECERRDVKGLYARAARGEIPAFTGRGSSFEAPVDEPIALRVDTMSQTPVESLGQLCQFLGTALNRTFS